MRRVKFWLPLLAASMLLSLGGVVSVSGLGAGAAQASYSCFGGWVASWAASPSDAQVPTDAAGNAVPQTLSNQSLRMIVTPHLGGVSLRIRLSNRFGTNAVTFGRVTVAKQTTGPAIGSATRVLFQGAASVTIPAGDDVVSDPALLTFSAFDPLAVSIYVPGQQTAPTKHWNANSTSYYSASQSGDRTAEANGSSYSGSTFSWLYVDGVDVLALPQTRSVVAFGDSITDGFVASTPLSTPVDTSVADKNGRYPDYLQRRLNTARLPISVVNAGMSANMLLTDARPSQAGPSGLQRFGKDALSQAGIAGVLVLEGINDLGLTQSTADQVIAGYTQLISQAHAAGVKIWFGTITPASNAIINGIGMAPNSERYRQEINTWIRGQHLADGFVDFDAALRNPANPSTLLPAYASVDNLHPNLAGYQAMANAVNLNMLAATSCTL